MTYSSLHNLPIMRAALIDMGRAVRSYTVWMMLGWNDIQQRYRRSALGPFWLTVSTLITVALIGPLYGRLMGQDLSTYYPYLACSLVTWSLLAGIVTDSCQAFIASEAYIKELPLPFTLYVCRVVWRNILIFGHNLVALVPLLFILGSGGRFFLFLWVPGILAVAVNGLFFGIIVATLCARFRDIPQVIQSLVQVLMFATPIMWRVSSLGKYAWLASFNPFKHFLDVVRGPILGEPVAIESWLIILGLTVLNFLMALLCLRRFRRRIAFWL